MLFADAGPANDGTIFVASVDFEARIVVNITIIQDFLGHVSPMKWCLDILVSRHPCRNGSAIRRRRQGHERTRQLNCVVPRSR